MFDEIDTSDDKKISLDEFKAALPRLNAWGAKISNPEAEFRKIDKNGGGSIVFTEFLDYALDLDLDHDQDIDEWCKSNHKCCVIKIITFLSSLNSDIK